MMRAMQASFEETAASRDVDVLVISGSGKYYCAGVNLAGVLQPMHPQKLHDTIYTHNKSVFDSFLNFPKPIIVAMNGRDERMHGAMSAQPTAGAPIQNSGKALV